MKKKVDAVTSRVRAVKQRMTGSPDFKSLDSIYSAGDFRNAVFIGQDIVATHSSNSEAKYKLALALSRNNQLLRAEAILTSIVPDNGSTKQSERRYIRALEVVRTKIVDAEKWVDDFTGSSKQNVAHAPAVGERNFPMWLRLAELHEKNARTGSDYFRTAAELLMGMHSWFQAAEQYRNLVLTGKSGQKDLRNYAKCLIRDGQDQRLDVVLAELNNLRSRAKQAVLTISDLAASLGEYEFAARDLNTSILHGTSDYSVLDKAQLRLRRAGRLSDAFQVGKIMSTIQHRDKPALRTGLYAEQLGLKVEAMNQYSPVIAASPEAPTAASLRLARLVASEVGDNATKQGLILAYGHWAKFDSEHRLLLELANSLDMDESQPRTKWGGSVEGVREETNPDSIVEAGGANTAGPVAALIDSVRADICTPGPTTPAEVGANASRELRTAQSLRYLADSSLIPAIHEAQKLVFAADNFVSTDLVFLAYVLARAGHFDDAAHALSASEENPDPYRYQVSQPGDRHKRVFRYLTLRSELPLFDHVFLWETHFGKRIDCNPYAMWQEVCKRDTAGEYVHIWVCDDPRNAPADVLEDAHTVVTRRESAGYWFALAVAKYLVNNASFSHEFLKREGQVHVNTWHGTPLKALGRDDHDSPYDYGNVSRNIIHSSDLVMPSKFTADTFLNRYSIGSLCPAQVHILGQARNDRLLNMTKADRLKIRESLGVSPNEMFVLYAPTWRGGSQSSWFDVERLEQDLISLGSADGYTVGFRGHPLAMKYLDNLKADVLVPDSNISTYDLLSISDALITDYSSLGIDFLCRERPVLYYVHDYDEYSATRGLYFNRSEFPGYVVDNIDELLAALQIAKEDELLSLSHMKELRDSFAPFDDGNASARAVDVLLSSTGAEAVALGSDADSSPILLTHDLSNRDSLEAFVRTANALVASNRSVMVVFNQSRVAADPGLVEVLDSLSPDIHVLPRKGMFVQNAAEFAASEQFIRNDSFVCVEGANPYLDALAREAYRLFGSIRFSLAVSWGADDAVLTGLCAHGVSADRRIVYFDTDIADLWTRCFPSRKRAEQLFPGFDEIMVSSAKSQYWLQQNTSIENARLVGRSIKGFPGPGSAVSRVPSDSVVVVGSDTDLNSLRVAIAAAASCVGIHNTWFGCVVVYVQGSAREAVAEMLRKDFGAERFVEIRTDEFPYDAMKNPQLLLDCVSGEVPSVAMLDAFAVGVPAIAVASVFGPMEAEGSCEDRVDAIVHAVEATWLSESDPGTEVEDIVPDLTNLLSEYMSR